MPSKCAFSHWVPMFPYVVKRDSYEPGHGLPVNLCGRRGGNDNLAQSNSLLNVNNTLDS